MRSQDLRAALTTLGLVQRDLAKLVHVTPRAVSLWLSGGRAVPGPLAAYLNLLLSLPLGQREAEFARLGLGGPALKQGMYRFRYSAPSGSRGEAILVFDGGRVFGTDAGKSRYDGVYVPDHESGLIALQVRIELRAGEKSVVGPAQPFDWILEARGFLKPRMEHDEISFDTNLGTKIDAVYDFMRPLPSG